MTHWKFSLEVKFFLYFYVNITFENNYNSKVSKFPFKDCDIINDYNLILFGFIYDFQIMFTERSTLRKYLNRKIDMVNPSG